MALGPPLGPLCAHSGIKELSSYRPPQLSTTPASLRPIISISPLVQLCRHSPHQQRLHGCPSFLPFRLLLVHGAWALELPHSPCCPLWLPGPPAHLHSPDLSCLMRPLLALGSTGRKSLNQVISGSGLPLAAHSIVAVRVRSTTFSWGPMSMLGKPGGSWSSAGRDRRNRAEAWLSHATPPGESSGTGRPGQDPQQAPYFPSGMRGLWLWPTQGLLQRGQEAPVPNPEC